MRTSRSNHVSIAFALLLAMPLHDARAQTPAPVQADGQAPATVVITAPRPADRASYQASETRIKRFLKQRPTLSGPFLSWCMQNQFIENLDIRVSCGRTHILATDTALKQGLEAFDKEDYAAALALFQQAYSKIGNQDAALMLAKMHFDGLGTPKDKVQAIKWLMEVAMDRFDPWRDRLRFNPQDPQAMNARIEADLMLARIYERGDGAARDWEQAQTWYAKAVEAGYNPAAYELDKPGNPALEAAAVKGKAEPEAASGTLVHNGEMVPNDGEPPTSMAAAPDDEVLASVAGAHGQDKPALPDATSDKPAPDPGSTGPQDQADIAAFMVVRVTGLRAVPWKSYRAMRAAVAAYEKYRSLAPDAVFRFAVLAPAGKALPANFKLRVRTEDGHEFPITLENGELFQLPVLPDPEVDADLVSNLKGGQLRIGLLVHTPSVPPEKERLGDVRLRSEITQAIAEVDDPGDDFRCYRKRRGNDCKRPHFALWHRPRAPTTGASIVEANHRQALEANDDPNDPAYKMPIFSGRWSNDAVIEFAYKKPLPPLKLSQVAIYDAND
jgi:TPR repeat protein